MATKKELREALGAEISQKKTADMQTVHSLSVKICEKAAQINETMRSQGFDADLDTETLLQLAMQLHTTATTARATAKTWTRAQRAVREDAAAPEIEVERILIQNSQNMRIER